MASTIKRLATGALLAGTIIGTSGTAGAAGADTSSATPPFAINSVYNAYCYNDPGPSSKDRFIFSGTRKYFKDGHYDQGLLYEGQAQHQSLKIRTWTNDSAVQYYRSVWSPTEDASTACGVISQELDLKNYRYGVFFEPPGPRCVGRC